MVAEIISAISDWLTGFWTFVSTSITSAIEIFYGGSPTPSLTPLGVLALFGVAVGVVYLGLGFVSRFFKK